MGNPVYIGRNKPFNLKDGKAVIPRIGNGTQKSFAWKPGNYLIICEITAAGLDLGKELQAKIVKIDSKTRSKQEGGSEIQEIIGTGGGSMGRIVAVVNCSSTQRLRLRLQTFNGDITIKRIISHVVKLG